MSLKPNWLFSDLINISDLCGIRPQTLPRSFMYSQCFTEDKSVTHIHTALSFLFIYLFYLKIHPKVGVKYNRTLSPLQGIYILYNGSFSLFCNLTLNPKPVNRIKTKEMKYF